MDFNIGLFYRKKFIPPMSRIIYSIKPKKLTNKYSKKKSNKKSHEKSKNNKIIKIHKKKFKKISFFISRELMKESGTPGGSTWIKIIFSKLGMPIISWNSQI